VSLRLKVSHFLALVVVAALAVGLMAGPASAKMSGKKKAQIQRQLKKAVKKHPNVVGKKWFLKKASLVNFKLPVTLRLRGSSLASNPNNASVDLGASLGKREIDLGGSLSGEIVFHDSYDGGALGNVDLSILPSQNHQLTSTSIPLLWNTQVSGAGTRYDWNSLREIPNPTLQAGLDLAAAAGAGSGCGNFLSSTTGTLGLGHLNFGAGFLNAGAGTPGYPFWNSLLSYAGAPGYPTSATPEGYLRIQPGVDSIDQVAASKIPGNNFNVGGNPSPFPYSAQSSPSGITSAIPSPQDTVLRTNALNLNIAAAGTEVKQDSNANGVQGSQNLVLGKSGGQANLFGNIPGKAYGIDVTVNLATRINSILRVVDQDSFGSPLVTGAKYPAGIFNCRQIWSGGIDNYIPSVRLAGNLKIAPAITSDGKLRIAKATVSSLPGSESRFAVAACLVPYSGVDDELLSSDTAPSLIPAAGTYTTAAIPAASALPANPLVARGAPAANCNAAPTALVRDSALGIAQVQSLAPAVPADGYTSTNSGSAVSVGADLSVGNVSLDVLVGDV
jgi:hypothetical protein